MSFLYKCLIALVLAAALGFLAIAPVAAEPILTLDSSAGPCDATVTAIGEGFPPGEPVELTLGRPSSDARGELLAIVTSDGAGSFRTQITFGEVGCVYANSPLNPERSLGVIADEAGGPDDMVVFTTTSYRASPAPLPDTGAGIGPPAGMPSQLLVALFVAGASLTGMGILRFLKANDR
jgi:hypothetical protein